MSSNLNGKDILHALKKIRKPANLTEILEYLSDKNDNGGSKTKLLETAKDILETGVLYGFIMKNNEKYIFESASDDEKQNQPEEINAQQIENKEASTVKEKKNVPSSNELQASSESLLLPKAKLKKIIKRIISVSSDEDPDIVEQADCYGPRSRRSKRSRSRSRVSGKRRSRRRQSRRG